MVEALIILDCLGLVVVAFWIAESVRKASKGKVAMKKKRNSNRRRVDFYV